jgi:hypothetical protein
MKKTIAATVLVLATASACSGTPLGSGPSSTGTPTPTFTPQEQAAITSLTTAFSSGKLQLAADQASAGCVATGLVSKLGVEKLQTYKVIKSTMDATKKGLGAVAMSEADATTAADVVLGCIDPLTAVQKLAADVGLKKKQARCLSQKLTPDALHLMFVAYLDQQPSLDPSVIKPLKKCT